MQVERYIRAYNKNLDSLIFEIKLPTDALTFLSTIPSLMNRDDPLLYYCYGLTKEQTDFIHYYFFMQYITDTDYFDYYLECDAKPEKPVVKTKEELLMKNYESLDALETTWKAHPQLRFGQLITCISGNPNLYGIKSRDLFPIHDEKFLDLIEAFNVDNPTNSR